MLNRVDEVELRLGIVRKLLLAWPDRYALAPHLVVDLIVGRMRTNENLHVTQGFISAKLPHYVRHNPTLVSCNICRRPKVKEIRPRWIETDLLQKLMSLTSSGPPHRKPFVKEGRTRLHYAVWIDFMDRDRLLLMNFVPSHQEIGSN